jgi:hypothetical protein
LIFSKSVPFKKVENTLGRDAQVTLGQDVQATFPFPGLSFSVDNSPFGLHNIFIMFPEFHESTIAREVGT